MRQAAVLDLAAAVGWLEPVQVREAPLPERHTLSRFHRPDYLAAFETAARDGLATPEVRERYHLGTMECPIFPGLWERALASVGGAIMAAELALAGQVAFHPAGGTHHGRPERASGFCYFNDPVFAILTLLDAGLRRVAYVDLDAHHGDGVEAAYVEDERVSLLSIHEAGRWPGTGALGLARDGRICNIPVPRGVNDTEYNLLAQRILAPWLRRRRPEAVVITLGADGLAGDPLSSMRLANTTLWAVTEACIEAAPCAVVLGGGGYNPWTTARLWAGFWGRLLGRDVPHPLPTAARAVLEALDCDLVEAEDRDPAWTTRLVDAPDSGGIRPDVHELIATLGAVAP